MNVEIEEPGLLINKLLRDNANLEKEVASLRASLKRLKKNGVSMGTVEVTSHQRGVSGTDQ